MRRAVMVDGGVVAVMADGAAALVVSLVDGVLLAVCAHAMRRHVE